MTDLHDDYDDVVDCWNCGGDGFVYGCSWDWQCDTYDAGEGCCLCSRPCHICHPPKTDPALRELMGKMLASVGTRPEGGDAQQAPFTSDAVPLAADAQTPAEGQLND